MKVNMGNADRIIRVVISIVFVVLFAQNIVIGTIGYVLLGLAGIFTLTAIFSSCPIYSIVGLRTNASGAES